MIQLYERGVASLSDRCFRFQIGDVNVSVTSDLEEALEDLAGLYRGRRQSCPSADPTIQMEVRAQRRSLLRPTRYVISGDGQELFTDRRDLEVLPYLEWGINWRVMATRSDYLQLHSAAMVHGGQGVIFAGASGCGKSTLAAGLLSRGWTYLSDEFGLIDPDTTYLHSFPKALCIKAGSFDLIERLDLPLRRRRHYVKAFKGRVAYISPQDVGPQMEAAPGPIRFVIFPEYIEGGEPRLRPLSPGRAAFALAGHALNRNVFGSRAISILSAVVRGAECFRLESGPLEPTCALIDALVRDRGPAPARG